MSHCAALKLRAAIIGGVWMTAWFACFPAMAQEALRNGGFETGDLSGWTAGGPAGSSVTVVPSLAYQGEHRPQEGRYFVLLASPVGSFTAPAPAPTTLTQTFRAEAGGVISGWAIFRSGGFAGVLTNFNPKCDFNYSWGRRRTLPLRK